MKVPGSEQLEKCWGMSHQRQDYVAMSHTRSSGWTSHQKSTWKDCLERSRLPGTGWTYQHDQKLMPEDLLATSHRPVKPWSLLGKLTFSRLWLKCSPKVKCWSALQALVESSTKCQSLETVWKADIFQRVTCSRLRLNAAPKLKFCKLCGKVTPTRFCLIKVVKVKYSRHFGKLYRCSPSARLSNRVTPSSANSWSGPSRLCFTKHHAAYSSVGRNLHDKVASLTTMPCSCMVWRSSSLESPCYGGVTADPGSPRTRGPKAEGSHSCFGRHHWTVKYWCFLTPYNRLWMAPIWFFGVDEIFWKFDAENLETWAIVQLWHFWEGDCGVSVWFPNSEHVFKKCYSMMLKYENMWVVWKCGTQKCQYVVRGNNLTLDGQEPRSSHIQIDLNYFQLLKPIMSFWWK